MIPVFDMADLVDGDAAQFRAVAQVHVIGVQEYFVIAPEAEGAAFDPRAQVGVFGAEADPV